MRARFNERETFRNTQGYTTYEVSVPGIEIFVNYESNTAAMFGGRRSKADWKYKFGDKFKMIKYIEEKVKVVFDSNKAKEERKLKEKMEAELLRANVQVGDLFHTSWGYEQTNVDFFQVVERKSPTRVVIRQIAKETVEETSWCSDRVSPLKDTFIGEAKTVTISKYGNLSNADHYGNNAYPNKDQASFHRSWGY